MSTHYANAIYLTEEEAAELVSILSHEVKKWHGDRGEICRDLYEKAKAVDDYYQRKTNASSPN